MGRVITQEQALFDKYGEVYEDMWDVVGGGCSWYCGGAIGIITASSHLAAQGTNSYDPENLHDLNFQTAWVEGVPGYGIGEFVEYEFPPGNPRITKIIVANGYVKSEKAYQQNSRVKKLKMFVNEKPQAILHLKDETVEQIFEVDAIGYAEREELELLASREPIRLRFEILEVYKGDRYDDVALSEIYFDGLDVHCLAAGTMITMADGSKKPIEKLVEGEQVLSYDPVAGLFEPAKILELAEARHDHLVQITFDNQAFVIATRDHPFFDGKYWYSCDPMKTMKDYRLDLVKPIMEGTRLLMHDDIGYVQTISTIPACQLTYTIVRLDKNEIFLANGVLVGIEKVRAKQSQ